MKFYSQLKAQRSNVPYTLNFSYRVQFLERIKEAANPHSSHGDNNETIDSINAAADSSTEKRDMQLR